MRRSRGTFYECVASLKGLLLPTSDGEMSSPIPISSFLYFSVSAKRVILCFCSNDSTFWPVQPTPPVWQPQPRYRVCIMNKLRVFFIFFIPIKKYSVVGFMNLRVVILYVTSAQSLPRSEVVILDDAMQMLFYHSLLHYTKLGVRFL